jgi:hypothetical protein
LTTFLILRRPPAAVSKDALRRSSVVLDSFSRSNAGSRRYPFDPRGGEGESELPTAASRERHR